MSRNRSLLVLALSLAPLAAQGEPLWEQADYGPFFAQTISSSSRQKNTALKGVAVRLGTDAEPGGALFDTELLRVACGWTRGFITLRGTPYDGSHGPHSRAAGPGWFETEPVPGWSLDGKFEDLRPIKGHGPLPRSVGRYRGLYRGDDRVVFAYDVAGSRVLDSVTLHGEGAQRYFVRSLELAPCKSARTLLIADDGATADDLAVASPTADGLVIKRPARKPELITRERVDGPWSGLSFGAARGNVPIDDALTAAVTDKLKERAATQAADSAGDKRDGGISGTAAKPAPAAPPAVQVRSLPTPLETYRIHTYGTGDDAIQRFALYGSAAATPPVDPGEWSKLADVDTSKLGARGGHGVAIASPEGKPLGTFRHFLMVGSGRDGYRTSLRFVAFDVLGKDHGVRSPTTLATTFALRGLPAGTALARDGGRLTLSLQAHDQPLRFDVLAWHGNADALPQATAAMRAAPAPASLAPALKGAKARWTQTITAAGTRGSDDQAYAVDTVPVPFDNPYHSWMRTGAFDFFKDGTRAAVSTWNGDVWLVSGLDQTLKAVTWKRFATGMFDPLGLKIVDDKIYVHGRDGLTRLHDLNGDDEADFYEAFNHDVLITDGFHEFAFDLHTDAQGNFYFAKAGPVNPGGRGFQKIVPHHGCILKVSKDGEELSVYATGFRANNGIGVGPQGQVTSGDNEGTWMPKCRLSWVTEGSFNGCVETSHRTPAPTTYDKPLCWFPHDIDNSSGSQVWVTSDTWGPLRGELLHMSYGTCSLFKVMQETVDGQIQGGVVRIPVSFASSCMRARFNPEDGQLWVCGLKGWQTSAAQDGALQRVRYTGKPLHLPVGLEVKKGGVLLTFSDALDPETANDKTSFDVEVWNYIWGDQYGSPHISTINPDADLKKMGGKVNIDYRNSDKLVVTRAELRGDKQVFVGIEGLKPVMQMQIKVNVDAKDGAAIKHTIYNTVHVVPK